MDLTKAEDTKNRWQEYTEEHLRKPQEGFKALISPPSPNLDREMAAHQYMRYFRQSS